MAEDVDRRTVALRDEVDAFLTSLERAGSRRRFDRHPCELHATLLHGDERSSVIVEDLSEGGAGLRVAVNLAQGMEVTLLFTQDQQVQARVARCGEGRIGLLFASEGGDGVVNALLTKLVPGMSQAA